MITLPVPPPRSRSKTTSCQNLRALYGSRFRIGHDPAAEHEPNGRKDPWLMTIPCRYGEIFPHGGSRLCVEVHEGHPRIKGKLAGLPFVAVHQFGDDGFGAFLFDVIDFDAVAAIIKPRKRRQATQELREHLRTIGKATRIGPSSRRTDQNTERRTA